jgi:hypothetical protein
MLWRSNPPLTTLRFAIGVVVMTFGRRGKGYDEISQTQYGERVTMGIHVCGTCWY